jgi:hypothetical protein
MDIIIGAGIWPMQVTAYLCNHNIENLHPDNIAGLKQSAFDSIVRLIKSLRSKIRPVGEIVEVLNGAMMQPSERKIAARLA